MNKEQAWLQYFSWAREYGTVIYA
jgi:hypothetical protein